MAPFRDKGGSQQGACRMEVEGALLRTEREEEGHREMSVKGEEEGMKRGNEHLVTLVESVPQAKWLTEWQASLASCPLTSAVPLSSLQQAITGESGEQAGVASRRVNSNQRNQAVAERGIKRSAPQGFLTRKPKLCVRQVGQPWLGIEDTGWTCLLRGTRQSDRSFVSQWVLRQMSWGEVQVGEEVNIMVRFGELVLQCKAVVKEEAVPSFLVGDDLMRSLVQHGWALDENKWSLEDESDLSAPRSMDPALRFEGGVGEDQGHLSTSEEGERMLQEQSEFWDALIDQHTQQAVDGDEPGGLITGEEWAPQSHLLQRVCSMEESVGKTLPAGPTYATVEDNPVEYKDRVQCFIPGHIHTKVEAWRALRPRVDVEVLAWIEQGYQVKRHEAAMNIRCRNGKVARENEAAVRALFVKRVLEGSWETAKGEDLINIIPINLAPKPGAEVPWRWLINGQPVNDSYAKWKVRYEGLRTLPLVLKPGDYMICIDLHSGYDALRLTDDSRVLFGVRVVLMPDDVERLLRAGKIRIPLFGQVYKDGRVEVFGKPVTLPQGFTLSCGIFTKLTRQMVRVWRSKGWRLAHLLDDLLFADQSEVRLMEKAKEIIAMLESLGFFVAWNKSILKPTRIMRWVGWVLDTVRFVIQVPGDKVEAYEDLVQKVKQAPDEQTVRRLASLAGKLIAMSSAIPFARLLTRETYRCICPEKGWDATAEVTPGMLLELTEVVRWLRPYNSQGTPIRRGAKMQSVRLMLDGSPQGFGVRVDGQWRDVGWTGSGQAAAADWEGPTEEFQVYRELLALEEVLKLPGIVQHNISILLWTDCKATERYVQRGSGRSDVLTTIMKRIWIQCVDMGLAMWAEHVPGTLLVTAGVDALSRSSEFVLAHTVFQQLMQSEQFGKRGGFSGCTVDLCASVKTKRLLRYCSRNQVGKGSLGDMRSVELSPQEYYYVCPPWGTIDFMIRRLEDAEVAAVIVVPNWEAKAWHVWLRESALHIQVMPWRTCPAVWLDVAEHKVKPHELAQRFEFVAFAVDFRREWGHEKKGVSPVGRWKDKQQGEPVAKTRLQLGRHRYVRPPARAPPKALVRVLSLCGGMGTVGWCFKRVVSLLHMEIRVEVVEVEWCASARAMGTLMSGDVSRHHEVCDVWEWASDDAKCEELLKSLGHLDLLVCGFSCQDVSAANREGMGLKGAKSSVFFAIVLIMQIALKLYPQMDRVLECTDFEKKHPRDWAYVNEVTGTPAVKLEAGEVARCWRNRAFWASYRLLPLMHREVDPSTLLEPGRTLLHRWRHKLPTITTHSGSWNMARVVRGIDGRQGPLTLKEVKRAMGYGQVMLEEALLGNRTVTPQEVWRACGNAIHASVLCHVIVSWLITAGYITRDDPRLEGQPWTVNQDGPKRNWSTLLRMSEELLEEQQNRRVLTAQVTVQIEPLSGALSTRGQQRLSGSERALMTAAAAEHLEPDRVAPTWASVYDRVDGRGVPQLRTMQKHKGARPVRQLGQEFWEFVDDVALDLMILSRQDSTWRQYAAWFGVYEEFCDIMGVQWWTADIKVLSSVLVRSLAVLYEHEAYSPKTLELYITAVSSSLMDRQLGSVRHDGSVNRVMEGIKRSMGMPVQKKLAIEGLHIASWLGMDSPGGDGNAWTKAHAPLQWQQFVAVSVLAWSCFLRVSEVLQLQVCDLTLWGTLECPVKLEVLIRSAKADQRGITTVTVMDAAAEESPVCLLRVFLQYMIPVHGGVGRTVSCTKTQYRGRDCGSCAYVFPLISVRGVELRKQCGGRLLRKRMSSAVHRLVEGNIIDKTEGVRGFSLISFRRGGNSVAAAMGVRAKVRENHGRWGLAGQVEKGLTSEAEYTSTLARDAGVILTVLNADVARYMDERQRQVRPVRQGGPRSLQVRHDSTKGYPGEGPMETRAMEEKLGWFLGGLTPAKNPHELLQDFMHWHEVLHQVKDSPYMTEAFIMESLECLMQHFGNLLAMAKASKSPQWEPKWQRYVVLVRRQVENYDEKLKICVRVNKARSLVARRTLKRKSEAMEEQVEAQTTTQVTVQVEPLSDELSAQAQQRRRNGAEGPSVGDSGATVHPRLQVVDTDSAYLNLPMAGIVLSSSCPTPAARVLQGTLMEGEKRMRVVLGMVGGEVSYVYCRPAIELMALATSVLSHLVMIGTYGRQGFYRGCTLLFPDGRTSRRDAVFINSTNWNTACRLRLVCKQLLLVHRDLFRDKQICRQEKWWHKPIFVRDDGITAWNEGAYGQNED